MKHLLMALGVLATLNMSCTKTPQGATPTLTKQTSDFDKQLKPDIVSDRPQTEAKKVIAFLKLNQPALLTTSTRINGVTTIDPEQKDAVEQEQNQVVEKLKAISEDIEILYQYKLTLNAIAAVIPIEYKSNIEELSEIAYFESESTMLRPRTESSKVNNTPTQPINDFNSTTFIGADQAHNRTIENKSGNQEYIMGQGINVGIIDTGIDYTHSMLGGNGNPEEFKNMNPDQPSASFPNAKVVGGIDLVGTQYNAGSDRFELRIPHPDSNPIDEGGHGTHVAGTVAGLGDGINTYNGVAPKANLWAIKVFGAKGSVSDIVVVAALEYAADPNRDLDLSDQLDVVNLSLGGDYGKPQVLYKEAVKNLVRGGTSVIAAAGNAGHFDNIVGSPSTADEAFSVAASIDGMDHNWKFDSVKFTFSNGEIEIAEAIEGNISKPVSETNGISGELVSIGLADSPLDMDMQQKLRGKVALIDRGKVTFAAKLKVANDAGAIGAVVVNNVEGDPIAMGGDETQQIPAIMITQELGNKIKQQLSSHPVSVLFNSEEKISRPELIDTLTGFSSKGPRSFDSAIKPEIAAPGQQILSADMGSGNKGVRLNGTSMATPHMTGVMALIKQAFSDLTPLQHKSIVMSSALPIDDKEGVIYPISQQGAGRVQVGAALDVPIVFDQPALSLGEVPVGLKKVIKTSLKITNISNTEQSFSIVGNLASGLSFQISQKQISIAPNETKPIEIYATINPKILKQFSNEVDGYLLFKKEDNVIARIPVLVVANKVSNISVDHFFVMASNIKDSAQSVTRLSLKNNGYNQGDAFAFNLIAMDSSKPGHSPQTSHRSRQCDLQAAGYRILNKQIESKTERVLQIGIKLYKPVSAWDSCEISLQIDTNLDGVAEQELVGIKDDHLKGLFGENYASYLLNATKVRNLRRQYEEKIKTVNWDELAEIEPDYTEAIIAKSPFLTFNHSTVSIVEVPIDKIAQSQTGSFQVKLGVLSDDRTVIENDDFLEAAGQNGWFKISPDDAGASFVGLPEKMSVDNLGQSFAEFTKGEGEQPLLLLFPNNKSVKADGINDFQMQVLQPEFKLIDFL